jgi:hypothetical protein
MDNTNTERKSESEDLNNARNINFYPEMSKVDNVVFEKKKDRIVELIKRHIKRPSH